MLCNAGSPEIDCLDLKRKGSNKNILKRVRVKYLKVSSYEGTNEVVGKYGTEN